MRILFITNNFPPIVDGVGDYTYNIANQFVKHNHEVYIVCKKNPIINIGVKGMTVLPIIEKWNNSSYKSILKLINEKKIDVVSLQYVPHGFHPKGLPFPIIKLTKEIKKSNTKLFTFFHEVSVEKEKGNIRRTLLSIVMQYISKKIIENSDYVATSIEYYRNMMLKLVPYKKNIPLIPIASNIPETTLSEKDLLDLKKRIAPNNEVIISFFGIRNIQNSVDAISSLKREGYKIKILLIGKTSKYLPKNLPSDTIKTGVLEIEEIDKFIKVSDIFILSEGKSGCSFKSGSLAAGLRNKLPIITSKGKLTSSTLEDRKNILFTDFNNSYKISNTILYILNNKEISLSIGREAYNTTIDFTWNETYNKYINLLNNVQR